MQDVIKGLTSGSVFERCVTFCFLMASLIAVYYGLLGLLRMIKKGKFGPVEIDTEAGSGETGGADSDSEMDSGEWPSLLHHRFFKLLARAETPHFFRSDTDTAKGRINEAFLSLKFRTFRCGIREFVVEMEEHGGKGIGKLADVIVLLVKEYEREALRMEIELPGGGTICGVPRCYLSKFGHWHAPHESMAIDNINDVLADRLFPCWQARLSSALDYLHMAFQLTVEDGQLTLPMLNGDLDREIEQMICSDEEDTHEP